MGKWRGASVVKCNLPGSTSNRGIDSSCTRYCDRVGGSICNSTVCGASEGDASGTGYIPGGTYLVGRDVDDVAGECSTGSHYAL